MVQIVGSIVAFLAWWIVRTSAPRTTAHAAGGMVRLLRGLALLLPARDRERFVGEVAANIADRRRWWQWVEELLSVAAAIPGLAVILRWARRRQA